MAPILKVSLVDHPLRAIALGDQPYLIPGARGIIHYKTVVMVVPARDGGYRLPGE